MPIEPNQLMLSRRALLGAAMAFVWPTKLPAASQRIVSLDYGLASTLLGLGVVPVAISELAGWDKWVGEPLMPMGVADLGGSLEINFEILLALKPDLILTTPYLDDLLPKLQAIAPVFRADIYAEESGPVLPAAIKATRILGAQVDRSAETEVFLAKADALFEDCRRRLSRVSAPPVVLIDFMDARHARIYGSPGIIGSVLERVGLRNAWQGDANYWGFQTIAIEELSKIADPKARLIVFDPMPDDVLPTLKRSPLWQALPFARPEQFSRLPAILLFGMVNEAMRFARLLTDLLEEQA